jgi:dihydropteroate synthase
LTSQIINFNKSINNFETIPSHIYSFGKKKFDFNNAYVMGILNVTPDSFSDGGNYFDTEKAVSYGLKMLEEGADIIDIGGESTRPGSDPVTASEELNRIIPVIEKILNEQENAVISVDTTKVKVAEAALKCGAQIINDISGGVFEPEIFDVAKGFNAGFVIMHIKGKPKTMQQNPRYKNLLVEVQDFLEVQSAKAQSKGLEKIFLDPGIGFGKSVEDNFKLLNRLDDFKSLSYPLLIGLSRKSFIGQSLNLEMNERDEASNALNLLAIHKGARIIRTHNVKLGAQTCRLMNKMILN